MKTLDDYKDDVCEALGCDDRSDLHREHVSGCFDVDQLLTARDAEHATALAQSRAECEALRADVKFLRGEVTKCSVMSEEWGKERKWAGDEIETLKAQLDRAVELVGDIAAATCPMRFSEGASLSDRFRPAKYSDCGKCLTCRAQAFLAPAPSQPEPLAAKYRCMRHGDCTNQGAPHEGQEPQPEPVKAPAPWHLQRPIVPENAGTTSISPSPMEGRPLSTRSFAGSNPASGSSRESRPDGGLATSADVDTNSAPAGGENAGTTCGACKGCGGFDPKGTPMMGWHVLHGEKYRCAACDGSGRAP